MPLVVIVGIPCSGKTTLSNRLKAFFEARGSSVLLINEESLLVNKPDAYSSSFTEKNLRAALKSAVERSLSPDTTVILDSMNYIKGYRYELFCIVRQTKTTQCVVFLDIPKEIAAKRNQIYTEELFEDLANRMEVPSQKNKWDSPLVMLREGEEVPFEEIYERIFKGRNLTENMATVKQQAVVQDYVYLVDSRIQTVVEFILEAQENYAEGAEIEVEGSSVKYWFGRKVTGLWLRKAKQQFVKINKASPCPVENVTSCFVEYLNTSLTS
jgi:protein KTI12